MIIGAERLLLDALSRPKGCSSFLVVVLGEGDGDAAVVVLHQFLSQKDDWLSWGKNTHMFEVKDVGELLDEVAGCNAWSPMMIKIVDVAENCEVVAYPDASVALELFKMKAGKCCSQMALPKFGRCT